MRRLAVLGAAFLATSCGDGSDPDSVAAAELAARPASPASSAPPGVPDSTEPPEPEPTHVEHANGLVVDITVVGDGERARVGDRLRVHYSLRLAAGGEEIESTRASGIPYSFTLGAGEVIEAWERGLVGVRAGSTVRLAVPAELGYGAEGLGRIPPDSALEFEVHIVKIER